MKKTNYKRLLALLLVFLILSNSGISTYAAEQTSDPDTTITATDTDQSSDSLEMDSIEDIESTDASSEIAEDDADTGTDQKEKTEVTSATGADEVAQLTTDTTYTSLLVTDYNTKEGDTYYGSDKIIQLDATTFLFLFLDQAKCDAAFQSLQADGIAVEYNDMIDAYEKTDAMDQEVAVLEPEASKMCSLTDLQDATDAEEQIGTNFVQVAVIDTGVDPENPILKNRLMLDDPASMTDTTGHGTMIAEIIAANTDDQVKIKPYAAFDANGHSTVGALYKALLSAWGDGADVINISASGLGSSAGLTDLIHRINASGTKVVVAAGNNSDDVSAYVPGNIIDAITVSAADEAEEFAAYSNHGSTIDFSALGSMTRNTDNDDPTDDEIYVGTSIATANVTSYVAMILENNPDADVEANLIASAKDLGEEGRDDYYGNGFLTKENIISTINKTDDLVEPDKDFTDDLPEDEADIDLYSAAVRDELRANGDRTINLSGDIELTNLSTGTGTKTINGNGHVIFLKGQGDLITVGLFSYLTLNSCVIDGSRTYDNTPSGGTDLIHARIGRVDANWCTFQNNKANYGSSAYVSAMLDCSYGGQINASFCTFQNGYGNGFCVDNRAGDPYENSRACTGNAYGCTAVNIESAPGFGTDASVNNGNGFANSLGTMNLALCTAYSCKNGIVFNGAKSTAAGCDTYNCNVGLFVCGGADNTLCSDSSTGSLATSHICGDIGVYFLNGVTLNANWSFISGINQGVYVRSNATLNTFIVTIENYNDDYYYANYSDVQSAFGGNRFLMRQHWCKNGLNEGRVAGKCGSSYQGSGVYLESGTFNMGGGTTIKWCGEGVSNVGGQFSTNVSSGMNADLVDNGTGLMQRAGNSYVNEYARVYSNNTDGIHVTGGYGHLSGADVYSNRSCGLYIESGTFGCLGGSIRDNNKATNAGAGVQIASAGHFNMCGGSIYGNGGSYGRGIYNKGVSGMAGGKVSNQYESLYNNGTFSVTHGDFNANLYRSRYADVASAYAGNDWGALFHWLMNGIYEGRDAGSSNNTYINATCRSVVNNGTFTSITGDFKAKSSYNVYQNGNYNVAGDAKGWTNGIYLTQNHYVNIIGKLTCADGSIKVEVQPGYNALGHLVATCSYSMNYQTAAAMNNKFVLSNTAFTTSGTNRTAYLRAANERNGGNGNIILSEQRYVNFDANIKADGLTFSLPARVTGYWREDVTCPISKARALYKGESFSGLVNTGWNTKSNYTGTAYPVNASYVVSDLVGDATLYALWDTDIDLLVDGNEQTKGDNYILSHVSKSTSLPQNTFEKMTSVTVHDPTTAEEIIEDLPYSFQGWSLRNNAIYKDSDVLQPGQKMDTVAVLLNAITNGTASITDGKAQITIYVVWDQYPVIEATDVYCTMKQAKERQITEALLLKYAYATDLETIEDGNAAGQIFANASKNKDKQTLVITDFDADEFASLNKDGAVSVTFCATDGAGNRSYRRILVHIVDSSAKDVTAKEYTRFITRKYYEASETAGGLEEDSIWKTDATYNSTITDAFDRMDADDPIATYIYSHDQIEEIKSYVDDHGIGNVADENALSNFVSKYM
jgi:hypothetical protein